MLNILCCITGLFFILVSCTNQNNVNQIVVKNPTIAAYSVYGDVLYKNRENPIHFNINIDSVILCDEKGIIEKPKMNFYDYNNNHNVMVVTPSNRRLDTLKIIDKRNHIQERIFRVLDAPNPTGKLFREFESGYISEEEIKNGVAKYPGFGWVDNPILSHEIPWNIDTTFRMDYISEEGRREIISNATTPFNEIIVKKLKNAKKGDVFIFYDIILGCEGHSEKLKIKPMVYMVN